jgi:Mg/Co/Ni transporter MgtE
MNLLISLDAELQNAVCYAKHSRTFRTLVTTLGILTSLAPAVCNATHSRTFGTQCSDVTIRLLATNDKYGPSNRSSTVKSS